jgi:hypothetical protein
MERQQDVRKRDRTSGQPTLWNTDYVAAEQNLETLGYFSARYYRPPMDGTQLSKVITVSEGRRIEIVPSAKYGLPNAEDLDFYRAFLKICDERAEWAKDEEGKYHPQLPSPVGFSSRELIAKAGRHKNDRNMVAARNWMKRLNATVIHGELYDARAKSFDVQIGLEPLFKRFVSVGERLPNGQLAAQNYVWLSDWFLRNYFFFYTRRLDLNFHNRLHHAISKTLYPLLDNGWFASNGAPYTKNYNDLCAILDIKEHTQLSRVRHQLDASNEELMREQFVAKYDYPMRPGGEWTGNVRWWPGSKWLFDQEQKQQKHGTEIHEVAMLSPSSSLPFTDSVVETAQPLLPLPSRQKIAAASPSETRARSFYEQLGQRRPSRQQIRTGAAVLQGLVEQQGYSWEEIDFTLEWILGQANTRFNGRVQSVGIIPHVIGEALREKATHERQRERERTRQREEREEQARAAYRQALLKKVDNLPSEDREGLRREALRNLMEQGYQRQFIGETLMRMEMARLLESSGES